MKRYSTHFGRPKAYLENRRFFVVLHTVLCALFTPKLNKYDLYYLKKDKVDRPRYK